MKNRIIYFVDDDRMILHLLEYTLSGRDDIKVKSFRRGEDCLEALKIELPDLVVLDHSYVANNSEYDTGLKILRTIRDLKYDVKVIVLTADTRESLKDEYAQLGVEKFILKDSYFIDILVEAIKNMYK